VTVKDLLAGWIAGRGHMTPSLLNAIRKKEDLENSLDALGWPWNKKISLELDNTIETLEADDGHDRD